MELSFEGYQRFADHAKTAEPYLTKAPSDVVYALAVLAGDHDVEAGYVRYGSEGRETHWFGLWLVPAGLIHVSAVYGEPNWTGIRESNMGHRPPSAFTSWYRRVTDVKSIGVGSIDGSGFGDEVMVHGEAILELDGLPQRLTFRFGGTGSGASTLLAELRDRCQSALADGSPAGRRGD
ncbi:hypothetical protein [Nocardia mexicana]|uniref:Uncharacterized protein n=1 Tax=Nocardia mexicana TaxID=279262 RepID=A0A370H9L8_9NOCA|nr:hypothetical protein [Nocardia mexicana]RDI52714.1 hypothetical protein DFR68_10398 [Nocardia mexicana]